MFFVQLNSILGATSGEKLDGVDIFASNYINMFRSSVGDLQIPEFECKPEDNCEYTYLAIWFVFILMIYFMTIILNNFLIARVGSTYDNF